MAVTMQQVLAEIDREETDYAALARLGPDALPHLRLLVGADDPLKAAKAAYAAGLVGGAPALEVVRAATQHHDAQVRVAAAHGLQHLGPAAPSELVVRVLQDTDAGVRKLAVRTAGALNRAELVAPLTEIARTDPAEHLRGIATSALARMPAAPLRPTPAPTKTVGPR